MRVLARARVRSCAERLCPALLLCDLRLQVFDVCLEQVRLCFHLFLRVAKVLPQLLERLLRFLACLLSERCLRWVRARAMVFGVARIRLVRLESDRTEGYRTASNRRAMNVRSLPRSKTWTPLPPPPCVHPLLFYMLLPRAPSLCSSSRARPGLDSLFWIKNKLLSSSATKISRSCCGSLKYISSSSSSLL